MQDPDHSDCAGLNFFVVCEQAGELPFKYALENNQQGHEADGVELEVLVVLPRIWYIVGADALPDECSRGLHEAETDLIKDDEKVHDDDLSSLCVDAKESTSERHEVPSAAIEQHHQHARKADLEVVTDALPHVRAGCDDCRLDRVHGIRAYDVQRQHSSVSDYSSVGSAHDAELKVENEQPRPE